MALTDQFAQPGLSILLIEDNLDDVRIVSHFLSMPDASDHGLNRINLMNAQYLKEAELILKQQKVDLVLLDLHLPDGQGRTLVRRLCSNFPKIPFVAMTGIDETAAVTTELLLEGAQDFIRKDKMDGPTLWRSIQYALNRQKLAVELQEQKEELSISHAELATISEIASRDLDTPLDQLRTFTSQLEESIIRARGAIDPQSPGNSAHRQELLRELSEQMPSAIEMIKNALNDMSRLSNGIRTLSHLDNRTMRFEEVDCNAMVSEIIQANRAYIDTNRVRVTLQPLNTVVADKLSMREIFQGIFDNALKYLNPTRDGIITISSHQDLTYTTFLVRDNGRGMTEDEQPRVFEVFKRGNDVVHISGDGMGMTYVRALVRRHRGIIWFETQADHGTVFYFTVDNSLTKGTVGMEDLRPARDEFFR